MSLFVIAYQKKKENEQMIIPVLFKETSNFQELFFQKIWLTLRC